MSTETIEENLPRVLARPEHSLSRNGMSANAVKVLYRLHRSGYLAYLVGGGVRDLLIGATPKDFDVATSAHPEEIRRLFRNSRIIGRRFRLVHVLFRGETVEVSTFRATPEPPEDPPEWEDAPEETGEDGAKVVEVGDSNTLFGTPDEDARRRDFTINALFYNIADFSIIDHVGGLVDLRERVIRTIGDPDGRFEEDPVRMLRALEYRVRLDFTLDSATEQSIRRCAPLITEASSARLTYELIEGLRSGCARGIGAAWCEAGLFYRAFPDLDGDHDALLSILAALDQKTELGADLPVPSIVGALFLPKFMNVVDDIHKRKGRLDNAALVAALRDFLDLAGSHMHLANHVVHLIHHGLFTLTKLQRAPERGRQVVKLARQEYFPVAWDLFSIATAAGYFSSDVLRAWSRALDRVRQADKSAEVDEIGESALPARRRRRPRRRGRRRR